MSETTISKLFISTRTGRNVLNHRKPLKMAGSSIIVKDETCNKCNTPLIEETRATQHRNLGEPGLNVRRFLCECGCSSVELFHIISKAARGTRSTCSLLYVPMTQDEQNQNFYNNSPIFKGQSHVSY